MGKVQTSVKIEEDQHEWIKETDTNLSKVTRDAIEELRD